MFYVFIIFSMVQNIALDELLMSQILHLKYIEWLGKVILL